MKNHLSIWRNVELGCIIFDHFVRFTVFLPNFADSFFWYGWIEHWSLYRTPSFSTNLFCIWVIKISIVEKVLKHFFSLCDILRRFSWVIQILWPSLSIFIFSLYTAGYGIHRSIKLYIFYHPIRYTGCPGV